MTATLEFLEEIKHIVSRVNNAAFIRPEDMVEKKTTRLEAIAFAAHLIREGATFNFGTVTAEVFMNAVEDGYNDLALLLDQDDEREGRMFKFLMQGVAATRAFMTSADGIYKEGYKEKHEREKSQPPKTNDP